MRNPSPPPIARTVPPLSPERALRESKDPGFSF
jgi:hypothetical protein